MYMIYVYICSKYGFYCNVMYVYMYLYIMYFNIKDMICMYYVYIYICIYIHIYITYVNTPKSRSLNKYRNQSLASTSHPQLCGFPAAGRSLDLPAVLKVHNKAHLSVSPFSCRKMGVETKLRPVSFICNRKNRTCLD
jgi:hypothetical protein